MLLRRVIPCLDVAAGRVVKGTRFVDLRDEGDPAELARRYAEEGADEVVFLDITAAPERRSTLLEVVERTARQAFVPLTVGGGVRTPSEMRAALRAGADKVAVNTAAVLEPQLVDRCARRFGRQCVVVAIDARARRTKDGEHAAAATGGAGTPGGATTAGAAALTGRVATTGDAAAANDHSSANGSPGASMSTSWEVVVRGGRDGTGRDAVDWAREVVDRGAGEILLTSIDRDGTRAGYDLALLRAVSGAVTVPVIASGGAGTPGDLVAAIVEGGADAVLAASIFHDGRYSIGAVKEALSRAGVPVRPVAPPLVTGTAAAVPGRTA